MAPNCKPRGRTEEEARPAITPLTEAELATLLGTCKRWYPEWLDLIALAAWTGMRQGEVLGLQWAPAPLAAALQRRILEAETAIQRRGSRAVVTNRKGGAPSDPLP